MSDIVISVENLSKQYRLGLMGTGTLMHDLKRWWHLARGKEDPYLKIGESNDRTVKGDSDFVWSLRDISFDVNRGDVLGVIGRNGAGKSTLLKILSKVTAPTTGEVKIKGRIASLLEVGTGFHPELTGRENVFMNGAILGMTKSETQSKFEEIVDFSGVERYIDTPVKRYSSGMYVRLAFAVAAHLEPEILIIDEVLAVGDAEFQKKCMGKMQDVAGHGRTVLFVSHNMTAIKNLCRTGIFLENGKIKESGPIEDVINSYNSANNEQLNNNLLKTHYFEKISLINETGEETTTFKTGEQVTFRFKMDRIAVDNQVGIGVYIKNSYDERISGISTYSIRIKEKLTELSFTFRNNFVPGIYLIEIILVRKGVEVLEHLNPIFKVRIIEDDVFKTGMPVSSRLGYTYLNGHWQT